MSATVPHMHLPFGVARRFGLACAVAASAAFAAAPALARTVKIVVIGDSNVAGTGVASSETYPAQLEAALRARGLDVSVSNQGINGEVSGTTAGRSASIGSDTDIVVYWQGCRNDERWGGSMEACRANTAAALTALAARGIAAYPIRPPVYDRSMHKSAALTLGGRGKTIDYRDGRGPVPDGHLNGAGYAVLVKRTLEPIGKLVVAAQKKKG
ncbi:MAG: acyl-CoA thioesterase [Siculibacillus sp.]|nr:acyl-CoA thioesterase [Siculibacillus sp.]